MAKQSGSRKHGRNKRKPAMAAYTAAMRWVSNKRKRIEREAARQSACKAVRSLAANAGEPKVRDVCRRIRQGVAA